MSFNEMQWWQAYACCRPLEPDRTDMLEARIVGAWCGKDPNVLKMDWFSMENDPEWVLERDKATKERIGKKQKALNEKLAKEAAGKENGSETN